MIKPLRLILAVLVVLLAGVAAVSALGGQTPAIRGGIAELSPVTLGGSKQWILIRGVDANAPVVLKIHGGPGLAEMATRPFNAELEKHFVVVEWDQRGAGKSYGATGLSERQLVADTIELSDLLRQRFHRRKIIVIGHSWGSLLAAQAAAQRADLYCAYIATGQIVDYREGLGITARAIGVDRTLGPPPYADDGKRAQFLGLLKKSGGYWHAAKPLGEVGLMLKAPEYTLYEKLSFMSHAQASQKALMGDFLATDLRTAVPKIDVPVYLAEGRYDLTAPSGLARAWFDALSAPTKYWVDFDHSAHFPQWEEPAKFAGLVDLAAQNDCR